MRVDVGVAKLIGYGVDEEVPTLSIHVVDESAENVHLRRLHFGSEHTLCSWDSLHR